MKKPLLLSLAMMFIVGLLVLNAFFKPKPGEKDVKQLSEYMYNSYWWQGKYPPDFNIPLTDGTHFRLSEQIGKKVIILNFFTTWCESCKEETPELSAYYAKQSTEYLTFIGINVNEKPDLVKQYLSDLRPSFPVGIDNNSIISDQFNVKSYPTTIVIGVDGKIALYEVGSIANAEVVFDPIIAANRDNIRKHLGIDSIAYLREFAKQPKPKSIDTEFENSNVQLDGDALKFAERMHCPSCGKSLVNCTCNFCDDVKLKLKIMDFKDKTDEQILKDLFLPGEHP